MDIKFTYFDMPGRGEQVRLLLKYAKASFEDIRMQMADWPKEKKSGKFEFEQLPVLQYKGKQLSQTPAIMIFLGRQFGYMAGNQSDDTDIVNILNALGDLFNTYSGWLFAKEDRQTKKDNYYKNYIPLIFGKFEKKLKDNRNYIVGNKLSVADFAFAGYARATLLSPTEVSDYAPSFVSCPHFKTYIEKIYKQLG